MLNHSENGELGAERKKHNRRALGSCIGKKTLRVAINTFSRSNLLNLFAGNATCERFLSITFLSSSTLAQRRSFPLQIVSSWMSMRSDTHAVADWDTISTRCNCKVYRFAQLFPVNRIMLYCVSLFLLKFTIKSNMYMSFGVNFYPQNAIFIQFPMGSINLRRYTQQSSTNTK